MKEEPTPRLSTLAMVSLMATGLLLTAFVVAIVRGGGSGAPSGAAHQEQAESPRAARPSGARHPAEIQIDSPRGAVPREGLSFRWIAVEGVEEYKVTVYSTLMRKLWSPPRVKGESVDADEEALEVLKAGPTYHWTVTGFGENGHTVKSSTNTFRLVE